MTTPTYSVIRIPRDLLRRIRIAAATKELTIKDWAIRAPQISHSWHTFDAKVPEDIHWLLSSAIRPFPHGREMRKEFMVGRSACLLEAGVSNK